LICVQHIVTPITTDLLDSINLWQGVNAESLKKQRRHTSLNFFSSFLTSALMSFMPSIGAQVSDKGAMLKLKQVVCSKSTFNCCSDEGLEHARKSTNNFFAIYLQ
jgi:hypothetical protein